MPSTTTMLIGALLALGWYVMFIRRSLKATRRKGDKFAAEYKSFSHEDSLSSIRALVLGDEIAVGVGGTKEESIAARLADHLHASVENYATLGASMKEMPDQAAKAWRARYDLALILVGTNDILTFQWGALRDASRSLDVLLPRLSEKVAHIAVCTGGNVGHAPAYLWPINWYLSHRTRSLRKRLKRVCEKHDAVYVDIVAVPDIFRHDKKKYYAPDKMHVTGAAYEHWFGIIKNALEVWPELLRRKSVSAGSDEIRITPEP